MKNKIKILTASIAISLLFGLSACNKAYDIPAVNEENYSGKANRTITQLLKFHTHELDTVKKEFTITGIVISSDEYQNFYNTLTIQDDTKGINILVEKKYLYNEYKIGQRVFLKCKGLGLTDINGTPQIGWINGNKTEPISPVILNQYLYKDSLVGLEPTPIYISKVSDIQTTMVCKLVEIKNAKFETASTPFAVKDSTYTLQNLRLSDNSVIAVKTYANAYFANILTPKDSGNVKGVLIKNNEDYQIILRSIKDIAF